MKQISEHSAGGIVYRRKDKGQRTKDEGRQIKWLICKHSGYHKWVLPKGIIEEGETSEKAALREVQEETGVTAKSIEKITPEVRYTYQKQDFLVDKRVEFFLMEYVKGDIKNHSWEMEDVKWVSAEEALKLLEFPTERKTFQSASKLRAFQN